MSPNLGPYPTPPAWNTPASTGVTPKPTRSPLYQQHNGLLRKDTAIGADTCGWINGDPGQPFTCESGYTCVGDTDYTAFACCDGRADGCEFITYCVNGEPPGCDAEYACMTVGCLGDYSCLTWEIAGTVPLSLADCAYTTGTVTIDTTYACGPTDQQVPMPYTAYLVAASSSSAAAEASSVASFNGSGNTEVNDWVSHHKALLIGVIAGVVVLPLICCCFGIFRRKRRARARLAPVPAGSAPPQYSYVPQQETQGRGQGQEHYPMMQYHYGPNK